MSTANWIKLRVNIWEKPEVQYIADNCEIPVEYTVGMLCKVWTWFDQHTSEGITNKFGAKVLEKCTQLNVTESCDNIVTLVTGGEIIVTPFLQSMIDVDWITLTDDGLWSLIDWSEHNGETAKGRAEATKRQVKSRDKKKKEKVKEEQKQSVTESCDNSVTREEKIREEKIREENKNTLSENVVSKPKPKKKTLEERKEEFKENLKPYLEKYGKEVLNKFFLHFAEHNEGGSKMLFETHKTWNLGMRLAKWESLKQLGKPNSFTDSKNPANRIDPKRLEGCLN
tara:strand:+ start:17138 stop:17986 length:849 start_codon:yes stop_codon:yes gene_type:complete